MSRPLPPVDHLIYAAPVLEDGIAGLAGLLGVTAAPGGRHAQWGTHNAILSLGPRTYLEIMAPDPNRPDPESPVLFGLDRLERPRLLTWAMATPDLETDARRAVARGTRLGPVIEGRRRRPDRGLLTWTMTDPEVIVGDGLVPFLIDWGDTPHPASSAPAAGALAGLRAEHPTPARIHARLGGLDVDLDVSPGPSPALVATVRAPGGVVEIR